MSLYERPVRELLKQFVADSGIAPGQTFARAQVVDWFRINYPRVKSSTVQAHIIQATTNSKTRIHYNAQPRNDVFFQVDGGRLRLYEPSTDPAPIYGRADASDSEDEKEARDETPREIKTDEFAYEMDLKNFLAANLDRIEPGLRLFDDLEGVEGLEFPVGGRYVDILAKSRDGSLLVIELKVSRGYDRVVGQLLRYMAWVERYVAKEHQRVRGAIIANSISEDLKLACSRIDGVELFEYKLSVSLQKVIARPEQQAPPPKNPQLWVRPDFPI